MKKPNGKRALNQYGAKLEQRVALIQQAGEHILDAHQVVMEELIPKKNSLRRARLAATMQGKKVEAARIQAEMDLITKQIEEAYSAKRNLAQMGSEPDAP